MEENMENEVDSGGIKGLCRDPSTQIIPTLGPQVHIPTLVARKSPKITYIGPYKSTDITPKGL